MVWLGLGGGSACSKIYRVDSKSIIDDWYRRVVHLTFEEGIIPNSIPASSNRIKSKWGVENLSYFLEMVHFRVEYEVLMLTCASGNTITHQATPALVGKGMWVGRNTNRVSYLSAADGKISVWSSDVANLLPCHVLICCDIITVACN